jgi:hypothetical protein
MIMHFDMQDQQVAAAAIAEDGRWLGNLRDELQALLAPQTTTMQAAASRSARACAWW